MYTRIRKFFFRQKPFECKFTLEGIIMNFSKIALFAVAAYSFSQATITGNVVDESGARRGSFPRRSASSQAKRNTKISL